MNDVAGGFLSAFLRMMIGLALVRLILDGLLPEGGSARAADLGLGLAMMLCMLNECLALLQGAG